jgi:hypothetical protein
MALASTAFMAAPGLYGTNLDKIDCSDVLAAILLSDTSILGAIPFKGNVNNIEHFWIEDSLNAVSFTASSASSTTLAITAPAATTLVARILRTYAIVYPSTGEFRMQFASAPVTGGNTVTMYGSTTWVATASTTWYVAAMPKADISAASSDIALARVRRRNFTQVFERAIEITQTRKGVAVYAVPDELKHQIQMRTYEVKREMNMSVIAGYALASASNTYSPDSEVRTMAGLIQLIRDPDLDSDNDDNTVTQVSGALTESVINALAEKVFNRGGLDSKSNAVLVVPPYQQRVISAFEKDRIRRDPDERRAGYYITKFISDLGYDFPILVDRWMPADKVLMLDKSRVALMPLKGDNWHTEKMAVTGRSEKWQISGQFTLELRNPDEAHGLLYDLSTSGVV